MPTSDWAPTIAQVAAILRSRTKDRNGVEVGTFDANTRPTATQAQEQINLAIGDLVADYDDDLPAGTWDSARRQTALSAAMLIELSFFPEQVATGRSPYEQLKTLHEESIERFKAQYESSEDTDTAQGEIGAYGFPSYGFPEDLGGLVGWGTKF